MSRTLVYLSPDSIDVTVEIFLEDLFLFHDLQPNEANYLSQEELQRGTQLHRTFVVDRFVIRDATGRILRPDQRPEVTAEIPPQGVGLPELMNHRLSFNFKINLSVPPEFLTFQQTFSGPDAVMPAEMQLQIKQDGGPELLNAALVAGAPQTIHVDWSNPPLTDDASAEEKQRWLRQQSETMLGITSYSSVYSFLYIEDYEIRHEVLIPLLTLEESVPLPRVDEAFLTTSEQDSVRTAIEQYFVTGNPLEIDGRFILPTVARCDFYGVDFRDFAQQARRRTIAVPSGRVGIILSWPLSRPAQQLKLVWDRFSKSVWAVKMTVFAGEGSDRVTLSRLGNRNTFTWQSSADSQSPELQAIAAILPPRKHLTVPMIPFSVLLLLLLLYPMVRSTWDRTMRTTLIATLLLAGVVGQLRWPVSVSVPMGRVPHLSAEQTMKIGQQLLPGIYATFRYRREQDIYDALAVTVDGDLLQEIYLQLLNGLKMEQQGGAVARVAAVRILEWSRASGVDEPDLPNEFTCHARWNVAGEVEHWGHIHRRQNQFAGNFSVAAIDGKWKLTELQITDDRQLHFETKLRTLGEAAER